MQFGGKVFIIGIGKNEQLVWFLPRLHVDLLLILKT